MWEIICFADVQYVLCMITYGVPTFHCFVDRRDDEVLSVRLLSEGVCARGSARSSSREARNVPQGVRVLRVSDALIRLGGFEST